MKKLFTLLFLLATVNCFSQISDGKFNKLTVKGQATIVDAPATVTDNYMSVVRDATTGKLFLADISGGGGGGSETWQQTLINDPNLTQDNYPDVGGHVLSFLNADLFAVNMIGSFRVNNINGNPLLTIYPDGTTIRSDENGLPISESYPDGTAFAKGNGGTPGANFFFDDLYGGTGQRSFSSMNGAGDNAITRLSFTGSDDRGEVGIYNAGLFLHDDPTDLTGGEFSLLAWNPGTKEVGRATVAGVTTPGLNDVAIVNNESSVDLFIPKLWLYDVPNGTYATIENTDDQFIMTGESGYISLLAYLHGIIFGANTEQTEINTSHVTTPQSVFMPNNKNGDTIAMLSDITATSYTASNGLRKAGSNFLFGDNVSEYKNQVIWRPDSAMLRIGEIDGRIPRGNGSVGLGFYPDPSGLYSFATSGATASGSKSVSTGYASIASGNDAFTAGFNNLAQGNQSTAMGTFAKAYAQQSTALGYFTNCRSDVGTVTGYYNVNNWWASMVVGHYNDTTTVGSRTLNSNNNPVFVVGNGTSSFALSTAFSVMQNGNVRIGGGYTPAYKLDVSGAINVPGTTGNTYRWNAAGATPSNTTTPVGWLRVNVAGTDVSIPYYQ